MLSGKMHNAVNYMIKDKSKKVKIRKVKSKSPCVHTGYTEKNKQDNKIINYNKILINYNKDGNHRS